MTRFKQFLKWVGKAWPALWILLIIILHTIIIKIPIFNNVPVNEIIGMTLPVVGLFFVIHSINEDFQDFRNNDILASFKEYLKSCPLKKQSHKLSATSIELGPLTLGKPYLSEQRVWSTTEEGLKELERRIEDLRKYISVSRKEIGEEINQLKSQFKTMDGQNKDEINRVSNRLDKSVMGKVKHQLLGVFLILYGFVVNLILLF